MAERPHGGDALRAILRERDLLICLGSGGVGKTTTSAALALAAAFEGRRVLVLTIDPARRLLQALGLDGDDYPANTPLPVLPRLASAFGAEPPTGSLDAMMLDPEQGADEMFERLLPDGTMRAEVLDNPIYRAFIPTLSAAPDYVALELITELHAQGRWDLIVLDTPPTHNAVEFLEAGETLSKFINERVMKWFAKVPDNADDNTLRMRLLRRGGSVAVSVLGRLFGNEVMSDIATFFRSFSEVLPAMTARSQQTNALMRRDDTAFIAVTAPGETAQREAAHLREVLRSRGMPFEGFVVNRALRMPPTLRTAEGRATAREALEARLLRDGVAQAGERAADAERAGRQLAQLAEADEAHIAALSKLGGPAAFCQVVPQLEHDIHQLTELRALGAILLERTTP
jgi:anion-transporting  ArsA/GET3 family ATPase